MTLNIMDFRKREIPFNFFTRGNIEFLKDADSNIKYMNASIAIYLSRQCSVSVL